MERRLAAIFSTDVQGYSRFMGEDEAATVRTITAYRELMASVGTFQGDSRSSTVRRDYA